MTEPVDANADSAVVTVPYDKFNAFQRWEKSLEFAKNKSNALLARDGEGFRFI